MRSFTNGRISRSVYELRLPGRPFGRAYVDQPPPRSAASLPLRSSSPCTAAGCHGSSGGAAAMSQPAGPSALARTRVPGVEFRESVAMRRRRAITRAGSLLNGGGAVDGKVIVFPTTTPPPVKRRVHPRPCRRLRRAACWAWRFIELRPRREFFSPRTGPMPSTAHIRVSRFTSRTAARARPR
jgi:hypothetical protein